MISEKENFLMLLRGEHPEFVPNYVFYSFSDRPPASVVIEPRITSPHHFNADSKDVWGVEYLSTKEAGGALIPKPRDFVLTDIRRWRDVVKAPSLEGVDWEAQAKDVMDPIDRSKSAVLFNLHFGYFQNLMALMGFNEGLCAMYEEPEEVKALFEYMCDWYCEVMEKMLPYVEPDAITLVDDTAAWGAPFISPEMYHELVMPYHDRQAAFGRDRGLPLTMHNCGKCEKFIDDFIAMGVSAWDPAQTCNDLLGIKEKYKGKLAIIGGWDASGILLDPEVSEDAIRQSVRDTMDKFAPGGGYAFCGAFLGALDDPNYKRKNIILSDEVETYGKSFYKTHN